MSLITTLKRKVNLDLLTHVVLTKKILSICQLDIKATIFGLLPALDDYPPHFHRVYDHTIFKVPTLVNVGMNILSNSQTHIKEGFESIKLKKEKERFITLVKHEQDLLPCSANTLSAVVAIIFHLYLDTFNNPVQAFLPKWVYCAGQWKFWQRINYLCFKEKLYFNENIIKDFRRRIVQTDIWKVRVSPLDLIDAQISRLAELTIPKPSSQVVESGRRKIFKFLRVTYPFHCENAKSTLEFCCRLEQELQLIFFKTLERARRTTHKKIIFFDFNTRNRGARH